MGHSIPAREPLEATPQGVKVEQGEGTANPLGEQGRLSVDTSPGTSGVVPTPTLSVIDTDPKVESESEVD